jgi:hypothetical protein
MGARPDEPMAPCPVGQRAQEQEACRQLWAEVEAVLRKAGDKSK